MVLIIFTRLVSNIFFFWKILGTLLRSWEFSFQSYFLAFYGEGSEVFDESGLSFCASWWAPPSNILGVIRSCCRVSDLHTACLLMFLRALARPLVTCFLGVFPKFSEGLIHYCDWFPGKSSLCLLFFWFHEKEGIDMISSILSGGISLVAVFPHSLSRIEWKRGNRRMTLVLLFGFLLSAYIFM